MKRLRRMMSPTEAGLTLVELLISIVLSAMLVGVLATSLVLGVRGARATAETLSNSADAQSIASYLPQDIQSTQSMSDVSTTAGSGCAGTDVGTPVLRLEWTEPGSTTVNAATYFTSNNPGGGGSSAGDRYLLTRYFCEIVSGTGKAPSKTVVGRNLLASTAAVAPETSNPARLAVTFTDLQTDGSQYKFTIAGSFRKLLAAAATTTTGTTGTTTTTTTGGGSTTVTVLSAVLTDESAPTGKTAPDGFADKITVNLDSPAIGSTCDTGWTGGQVALGYMVSTVTLATDGMSVRLGLTLGSQATTSSTGFFVARNATLSSCNLGTVALTNVIDAALPVLTALTDTPGAKDGKLETNDTMTLTFSETITTSSTTFTVTEANSGSGNDTLSISGVTSGALDMGSADYVKSKSTVSAVATVTPPTTQLVVTVGALTNSGDLTKGGTGTVAVTPAATLKDQAGNGAAPKALPLTNAF